MRKILKIFTSDLKNLAKSKVAVIVALGVTLIPGIYAWLNIDSNWDPYGNTDSIPIAVVNEDTGATIADQTVNMGASITDSLHQNNAMHWVFTDRADAITHVEQSTYYGAIIIPADFSQQLTTLFNNTDLRKPTFDFYINNKKNPIAPIMINKAAETIQSSVNQAFVDTIVYKTVDAAKDTGLIDQAPATTDNLISQINDAKSKISQLRTVLQTAKLATDSTNKSLSALQQTIPILNDFATSAGDRAAQLKTTTQSAFDKLNNLSNNSDLQSLQSQLTSRIAELQTLLDQASTSLDNLDAIRTELNALQDTASNLGQQYQATLQTDLSQLSQDTTAILNNVTNLTTQLRTSLQHAEQALSYLTSALNSGSQLLANTDVLLADLQSELDSLITTIQNLAQDPLFQALLNLLQHDPASIANFISSPVDANQIAIYPVDSYGSEMAPFYSILACWVGCTILAAIIKVDLNATAATRGAKHYQKFFGKFLLFGTLATFQGLVIGLGDLALQVQTVNWPLFLLTLMISSFTFSLIIYALMVAFGRLGQAVSIVILVLQVAGSGGTFPIELLPRPFQLLQPFMPFYPAMNATRETIAGFYQQDYLYYLALLFAHILVALAFGLIISKYTAPLKSKIQRQLRSTHVIE
ncbi:YhgE/Pip domain-containing protein [Candidatus Saccharibacteria bacterium]|nr:YhgE/Pip domain-containing protein [Candidatus Saccharibacteria bacterium]